MKPIKITELLTNEIKKSKNSFIRIILVTIAVLIIYIILALTGNFLSFTGVNYAFLLKDKELINAYKQQLSGEVNDKFCERAEKLYRKYIDKYRADDEHIKRRLIELNENVNVKDIIYNHEYTYIVIDSETIDKHPEIDILEEDTNSLIDYAKNPKKYYYGRYGNINKYSGELQADYEKCFNKYQKNQKIVAGYFLGWDMAISIMQFLPALLGTVIAVSLFSLFSKEQKYNMTGQILTSKHGRKKLIITKLLLAWGLTTFQWILFQLSGIMVAACLLGLDGMNCTYFSALSPSVYGLSCIEYYIAQLLVSYFGTIFFAVFICLASCILNEKLSLIFGVVFTFMTSSINGTFRNSEPAFGRLEKLMALTPTQLIGGYNTYQVYQATSIGNIIIRLPAMTWIAIAVGLVICITCIFYKASKE